MADDNIFQQYLRPPKSVLEYADEYDQADARKQTLQQNALTLAAGQQKQDDYTRERGADNALSRLVSSGQTPDQVAAGLAQAGYGKQALAYTKQQQDLANAKATNEHLTAQTGKLTAEKDGLAYKQREEKRQKSIQDIAAFTDPQQALVSLALHEQAGDIDPEQAALVRQTIPKNPADFPKWQVSMLQRIMSAKDAAGQIAPDANSIATNARIKSEGDANRAVTVAGQNKVDARMREANGPGGKLPLGYRLKSDGSMEAIPGGPAASKVTDQQTKLADAQTVLGLLDLAEPLLDQSTQGYVGMGVDMAARAMGKSTSGAEAASELRALEGALISKMPKMSGPQSDKDVLLYRQMAGQIGDPTLPAQTKRAAMRTIRNINQRYIDSSGTAAPAKPTLPQGWTVEVK